jgi:hypothetical protein
MGGEEDMKMGREGCGGTDGMGGGNVGDEIS